MDLYYTGRGWKMNEIYENVKCNNIFLRLKCVVDEEVFYFWDLSWWVHDLQLFFLTYNIEHSSNITCHYDYCCENVKHWMKKILKSIFDCGTIFCLLTIHLQLILNPTIITAANNPILCTTYYRVKFWWFPEKSKILIKPL